MVLVTTITKSSKEHDNTKNRRILRKQKQRQSNYAKLTKHTLFYKPLWIVDFNGKLSVPEIQIFQLFPGKYLQDTNIQHPRLLQKLKYFI